MSDFWLDRPTLVTGATGLVRGGWWPACSKRADVTCLVATGAPERPDPGSPGRSGQGGPGDIRDQGLMERSLGEHEINTVFHLAAQTIVGTANRNPVSTFESNIQGTWAVLEACRGARLRSSRWCSPRRTRRYGDQDQLPYDESTPLQGEASL